MKTIKSPPQNILFSLVAIQPFPKNQKVALYFSKELKKYFSMSYGKNGIELSESDFSIIEKLKTIEEIEPLYFHDGSILNIDKRCSESILNLYENVSEGKSDFEDFIIHSDKHFLSILNYSVNRFKKET
jgi:hypothetical protein